MLLRFRCQNFRSIRDRQELSVVAQRNRAHEHEDSLIFTPRPDVMVMRCAAVYGANASGKTNILAAMRTFSAMVSDSQRQWKPTGPIPNFEPFLLDEVSRERETMFEIDFAVGSTIYTYGFTYTRKMIVKEWLIDSTDRDKVLFRRETEGTSVYVRLPNRNLARNSDDARHLDLISIQTRPNSLFLSAAAQSNFERLIKVYEWLTESFFIISPRDQNPPRFTAELCSSLDRKNQIKSLLEFADAGIEDIEVQREEAPEKIKKLYSAVLNVFSEADIDSSVQLDIKPDMFRHSITMIHRGEGGRHYPLDFGDESAGTKAYFYILGPLLSELEDGTTVLIDELESSLHPNLARQLVKIFKDPILNPNGAQLIFATHDTDLLDLDLLRRDQIWFASKDGEGSTSLAQLSDFKPRVNQDVASAYLNGRFGAVPFFDEALLRAGLENVGSASSGERVLE